MFKKELQCKPQSNLKNSDRKKILQKIGQGYDNAGGELNTFQQGNFENHDGTIHGILYTISHVNGDTKQTLPIWFQVTKSKDLKKWGSLKQTALIPTVYTLWLNPTLLPIVITNDFVLDEKIIGSGANLMKKGCYIPVNDIQKRHQAGQNNSCVVVGIASYKRPSYVKAVGVLETSIDSTANNDENGGVAVTVLHYLGDKLCEQFKTKLDPPHALLQEVKEDDEGNVIEEASPSLETESSKAEIEGKENEIDKEDQLSVNEVDEILTRAMYYTLTNDSTLTLPITSSQFISNHININLPKKITPSMVNVKKSSYKKTSKLLKVWEKEGFMKLKSKGGDFVITNVAAKKDKPELQTFISYQPRGAPKSQQQVETNKQKTGKKLYITSSVLLKPSGPQARVFFPNLKFVEPQDVRAAVEEYVKTHNLIDPKDKSKVLCNDELWLFMGKKLADNGSSRLMPRNQVVTAVTQSSSQLLKYFQIYRPDGSAVLKEPHKLSGKDLKIPTVKITTEMKMRRKIVTKVENLEMYGVDPEELASKLKIKCSASTSIGETHNEVLIQGPHEAIVLSVLQKDYEIQSTSPQYVTCENKLKNKKKSSTTAPSSK
ncbi:hypothetical protein ACO0RG_002510 [Hanseniaspora osmophila]